MGRRSNIEILEPKLRSAMIDCIRAHRRFTLDEQMSYLKERGFTQVSRSGLGRFLQEFDKKEALCANPNEGTVVTIVERGTGEVRVVKSSASGLAIAALIKNIGLADSVS